MYNVSDNMAIDNEKVVWLNKTKSEKGVRMFLDKVFSELDKGTGLVASVSEVERLIQGVKDYARFSVMTSEEGIDGDTIAWANKTKSGNGIRIYLDKVFDEISEGTGLLASVSEVKNLIDGSESYARFSVMTPDEEEEEEEEKD